MPATLFVLLCMTAASLAQSRIVSGIECHGLKTDCDGPVPVISSAPLAEDSACYVDRDCRYVGVPDALLGAEYVMMVDGDRDIEALALSITLSKPATLYLFIDNRLGTNAGGTPDLAAGGLSWVTETEFIDTALDVGVDEDADGIADHDCSIFCKSVPAGAVLLRGQSAASTSLAGMYGVAVATARVKASRPSPADGEKGVISPLLCWAPGATALFHNLYLGTSPQLTGADLIRPKIMATAFLCASDLIPGRTYYWRVDAVEPDGVTLHTGDTWSFTAVSPLPNSALGRTDLK